MPGDYGHASIDLEDPRIFQPLSNAMGALNESARIEFKDRVRTSPPRRGHPLLKTLMCVMPYVPAGVIARVPPAGTVPAQVLTNDATSIVTTGMAVQPVALNNPSSSAVVDTGTFLKPDAIDDPGAPSSDSLGAISSSAASAVEVRLSIAAGGHVPAHPGELVHMPVRVPWHTCACAQLTSPFGPLAPHSAQAPLATSSPAHPDPA